MKRRIACLTVCLLAVLLPLRALAAEETAAVQTRAGDWTPSRSAMPGEELHFRATLTLRTGESWTVRSVFSPGVEFLALTAVRADGEGVNASYYTLVTGARSKESAFALHLSARFSARECVCLTVEWTARLGDGCVTGRGRKPRISHRGERERPDRSERQRGGFRLRLFRFPRCALCRCARGGSSAAVRLLPALL